MDAIINEKIIEFGANNALNIIGQYGRDRKCRAVQYYTVSTDTDICLGRIKPDCAYEQFLEVVASKAILEMERLYDLNEEIEDDYGELYDNFTALKEEVTDEGQDN